MPQEQHRTTARVLDILETLSGSGTGMTLTELAQALQAPKSSLFPIVHTLEQRRYLWQDQNSGRYTVGLGVLVLGTAFTEDRGLAPVVQVMKDLVNRCQETCQLGILDQGSVLYIEREDSNQAIRLISRVGVRLPANATAIGKALLSGLTEKEVRRLYAGGMPRLTEQTVTDLEVLSTPQMACWAVPLRRKQRVFAALSISVPMFRCLPEKIDLVRRSLLEAQAEIERLAEVRDFSVFEN